MRALAEESNCRVGMGPILARGTVRPLEDGEGLDNRRFSC